MRGYGRRLKGSKILIESWQYEGEAARQQGINQLYASTLNGELTHSMHVYVASLVAKTLGETTIASAMAATPSTAITDTTMPVISKLSKA